MLDLMNGKLERYFIPAVIGFAPLALFLMNWDGEHMSRSMQLLREYTVPVFAAELFTIIIALREGALANWRELRPPRPALIALAGLLAVAVATAVFVAPNPYAASVRTGFWIVHLLFGLAIAFLCGRVFGPSDLVIAYLAGFAALALAFVLWAAGAIHRPIHWTWDIPAFTHIRHLGIYATAMIALSIGVMATTQRSAPWAAAVVLAAGGFGLALWTGARGPVLAIAAAVVAGVIVAPAARRPKAWGGAALSLALAASIVAPLPVPANNMGLFRTVSAKTETGEITTGRTVLWKEVVGAIERRPVFGYGEGQMTTVAPFYGMAQPHNLILQILLAWGVAGLICSVVLAFWFARVAIPLVRENEAELLGPFLAMVSLVALSMIDAALYHILPISIFAASAGLILASRPSKA